MTQQPREWLKFGGLLAVTVLIGAAFLGLAGPRSSSALNRMAGLPELAPAAAVTTITVPAAAQPASDLSVAFAATAERIRSAVVFIRAESRVQVPRGMERFVPPGQQRRRGDGSGFIISADGYILTNNHVVENAERIMVRLFDRREFEAEIVGTDPQTDVAVIKINANNLSHAALGNSDSVRVGEWVLAVGNPLGEDFSFTVTAGIVSAKGRVLRGLPQRNSEYSIMDFIQTDAVINPGNSGGPLVNLSGQVVGINSAIASDNGFYQGYGFAIPMNLARHVADQLVRSGRVTRAILGVSIGEITPEDADAVGLDEIDGVVVSSHSDDSPARRAGLQIGDVIVALNGEPVRYVAQLQQRVGFMRPGEQVDVTYVRRGGRRETVRVRLAEAAVAQQTASKVAPANDAPATEPLDSKIGLALRPVAPNTTIGNRILTEGQAGLAVTNVNPSGPAFQRVAPWGDPQGPDIITHVDGQRVRTLDEFEAAVGPAGSGSVVSLTLWNASQDRVRLLRLRVP
jgi:serine protease Do